MKIENPIEFRRNHINQLVQNSKDLKRMRNATLALFLASVLVSVAGAPITALAILGVAMYGAFTVGPAQSRIFKNSKRA